ncbi:MAG: bifunctional phosphoribosyl-AMP cyclohydrolase/phosphoribosyl-ATP diphosphatase HisIE [Hydrogenothermaceae bacterium]
MIQIDDLKFDENGLIPVITQSFHTGKVLMQAYANREAIEETIKSGYATYYSRSRKSLWKKGETSGNRQKIVSIKVDCDEDSLIYTVVEEGPACHTGAVSCFYRNLLTDTQKPDGFEIVYSLYNLAVERKESMPENSYITSLFKKGSDKIIQKVGEEAVETVIALKNRDKEEIIMEVSDLIFHLVIALVDAGVDISDIQNELLRRYK